MSFLILSVLPELAEAYYETFYLYSWQDDTGRWNFTLLSAAKNSGWTLDEIVSGKYDPHGIKHTIKELESDLSTLPQGTQIYWDSHVWATRLTTHKVHEHLKHPPKEMIDEVMGYAKKHDIAVDLIDHSGNSISH